jgi:hypothetical protein
MKQQLISIKDALWGDSMEMLETSILATGDEDAIASLIDLQVRLAGLGIHGGEWTQAQLSSYRKTLHRWGANGVGDPVMEFGTAGNDHPVWMMECSSSETGMTMWIGIEPDGYTHS